MISRTYKANYVLNKERMKDFHSIVYVYYIERAFGGYEIQKESILS
jgi:hypothetical protein